MPCGSAGLCAMVMQAKNANVIQDLIGLNSALTTAATTQWRGLLVKWFRISGWCPGNQSLGELLWLSNGFVPVVTVPRIVE